MKVIIGIDVGGSTTKIVGFEKDSGNLIEPLFVRATDPVTSIYGAFGRFTAENSINLCDVEKVMITGVGSSFINNSMYGLNCQTVPEFPSVGNGGLYLSGLDEAIVVSMGTGTAIIYAESDGSMEYLGGTGVGGGTLVGLSKKLLETEETDNIFALAEGGDLNNIDLRLKDITKKDMLPHMPREMTAANFGKLNDLASKNDLALGIINMIFETVAMLSIFAGREHNIRDIVLTGNLTKMNIAREIFTSLGKMFDFNFIIPENSQYGTVIGAALLGLRGMEQ